MQIKQKGNGADKRRKKSLWEQEGNVANPLAWNPRASQVPRGNSSGTRKNFPNAIRPEFRLMTARMSNYVAARFAPFEI